MYIAELRIRHFSIFVVIVLLVVTVTPLFSQQNPILKSTFVMTDELEPIYPDKPAVGTNTFTCHTPRGCVVSVNLVANNLNTGEDLSFEIVSPKAYPIQIYNLIAVPVEVNSGVSSRTETFDGKINPDVIRRAPFNIYDVLEPFDKQIKVSGPTMAFAVHCTIPIDANTGDEEILITIRDNDKIMSTFTWNLQIAKVVIPEIGKGSMGYTNWISFGNIAKYHECQKWSQEYWIMMEKYLALLSANRQNMLCIPLGEIFHKDKDQKWILNENRLTRLVKLCDQYHIYWLEGTQIGGRPNGDWSSKNIKLRFNGSLTPTDAAKEEVHIICGQLYECLKKNNWTGRWIQHLSDEPTDVIASDYQWLAREVKTIMPDIKIYEATISRMLIGAIDIWCPTLDEYQGHQEFFDERKAAGDGVWVYTCLTPTGPWLNRLLDMERLRPVYIGWGLAKYNLDGFLHWGCNYWYVDPYKQSVIKHPAVRDKDTNNELPAGDTHIVYPKGKNIHSSLRLLAHAIGCEDYELLKLAQKKNPQATELIINKIFHTFNDYNKQVNKYRDARSELLKLIDN